MEFDITQYSGVSIVKFNGGKLHISYSCKNKVKFPLYFAVGFKAYEVAMANCGPFKTIILLCTKYQITI